MSANPDLRVLTYNVHKGFSTGNRRFVLAGIRELMNEVNADLVFLQEICGTSRHKGREVGRERKVRVPDELHFEYLAGEAWPHVIYGKNASYPGGDHGNAILSKYPFQSWENISLSKNPLASRSILHGVLKMPGMKVPLHALCVHFGLFYQSRKEHLKALVRRIEEHVPQDEPLIIAGDFNDWNSRVEKDIETGLQVKELFHELEGRYIRTYPIWRPFLPVDRIYFRGISAQVGKRHTGGHWLDLSDHAALQGEFAVL
ncbi:MAG: endonuclease/exonuclease/phosphatase family protein [bacterium]